MSSMFWTSVVSSLSSPAAIVVLILLAGNLALLAVHAFQAGRGYGASRRVRWSRVAWAVANAAVVVVLILNLMLFHYTVVLKQIAP